MEVDKIGEAGCIEALYGLALSYGRVQEEMPAVAERLCSKDGGHNKFLESIVTWWRIRAPRYWWQEFDTYRVGITKQSESTMHTLIHRELDITDFVPGVSQDIIDEVNKYIADGDLSTAKKNLPEGFMQTRVVCVNYKALRNIIIQRRAHRLREWQVFIGEVREQVDYPQLLPRD